MRRFGLEDPSTPNHWEESLDLQRLITGIGLILKFHQTPDEWSRQRIWLDLQSIASTTEICLHRGQRGHKSAAEWCLKVSSIAERRAWNELDTYLLQEGERYVAEISGCTSNPIKY